MDSNKPTNARREIIDLPEARKRFLTAAEHNNRLAEKWSLALAVGNGGGMLAVSSQLLSNDLPVRLAPMLANTAWIFAFGLLLAGVGPGLALMSATFSSQGFLNLMRKAEKTGSASVGNTDWIYDSFFWSQTIAEAVAASLFAAGILYPLSQYTPPA